MVRRNATAKKQITKLVVQGDLVKTASSAANVTTALRAIGSLADVPVRLDILVQLVNRSNLVCYVVNLNRIIYLPADQRFSIVALKSTLILGASVALAVLERNERAGRLFMTASTP
ncbi:unnamed protein product [Gongylonema pulchrum]|uniref:G_PROTEIN_RECEP_F1_2 domain-containing protein n=1 Tax=Gongylonema pulchrum TaxID=637853 RepID=A0A183D3P6_9BILA|nr:unnamed protein product [Gongylonema pulchrum]